MKFERSFILATLAVAALLPLVMTSEYLLHLGVLVLFSGCGSSGGGSSSAAPSIPSYASAVATIGSISSGFSTGGLGFGGGGGSTRISRWSFVPGGGLFGCLLCPRS